MSADAADQERSVSPEELPYLNNLQSEVFAQKLARFGTYLEEEGKDPKTGEGYADPEVRISRFCRVVKWFWANQEVKTEITGDEADEINCALKEDRLRKSNGEPFADASKRKINDVLRNWFEFQDVDWTPEYTFSDGDAKKENKPDPYDKSELIRLWETSLTYKSIPSYNNLSPSERDRWKAYLAQEFGKPIEEVVPADWDRVNKDWHVPSLVRTSRSYGWRPDLVGRMKVDWYDSSDRTIYIPKGEAPKNNAPWQAELTDEGADALENWLDQRELMELYDGRDEIWLTREGNPYTSSSLNNLLDNLMEEAGIKDRGRKLVWYSFRHSIGTYVFAERGNLRAVANQLRQKSRSAAEQYVHELPERKREAANIM